jgi:hypothetical protein
VNPISRLIKSIDAEEHLENAETFLAKLRDARDFMPDNDPVARADMKLMIDRAQYAVTRLRAEFFGVAAV